MKRVKLLIPLAVLCAVSLTGCSFGGYRIVKEEDMQTSEVVSDNSSENIITEEVENTTEEVENTTEETVSENEPVDTQLEDNQEVISETTITESDEMIELDYYSRTNLKSLEEGKVYKMDLTAGRSGKKSTYNLVNNTSKDVLIYSQEEGVGFEVGTLELRHSFPKAVNSSYSSGIKTEADYVIFRYETLNTVNDVLNHVDSSRLVKLSSKSINVEFRVGNIRYLYNDTDSTVELEADNGTGYSIPAKTVAEFPSQGYITLKRVR